MTHLSRREFLSDNAMGIGAIALNLEAHAGLITLLRGRSLRGKPVSKCQREHDHGEQRQQICPIAHQGMIQKTEA